MGRVCSGIPELTLSPSCAGYFQRSHGPNAKTLCKCLACSYQATDLQARLMCLTHLDA